MKNKKLYAYNGQEIVIKSPLSYLKYLLTFRIALVGISLYARKVKTNSKLEKILPGIINPQILNNLNKTLDQNALELDIEYAKIKSPGRDFKMILEYIFKIIFFTNKNIAKKHINIFDINILNIDFKNFSKIIKRSLRTEKKLIINFLNANNLNIAYKDYDYKMLLTSTSNQLLLADGSGVKIASKLTNQNLIENLNGTDIFPKICQYANSKKLKFFFFGSTSKVVKKLEHNIKQKYKNIEIVQAISGYNYDNDEVINLVNKHKPDFLFVAMGTPLQEKWIHQNNHVLDAKVTLGVGGLFDFYAGRKKRAPLILRKLGLEWTYRLYLEPKRMWRRYILGNPLFLLRCLLSTK